MSFSELPHTADVRIRARSETLEGIFSDLTDALMQVMYGKFTAIRSETLVVKEVRVSGDDTASLLFNYLSEVLFLNEVGGIVFVRADVRVTGNKLHARLFGEVFDPARHSGGTEVKGISYSGLEVRNDANGYIAEIVFDV
ncbi:MAG TPA: archease [Methanoregulaceae archaeon]|nr:archease [Methanoregulaceae archaeon]